jgi:hypothetical protein
LPGGLSGFNAVLAPGAVAGSLSSTGATASKAVNQMVVTVDAGASPTVIDLGAVFAKTTGLRHKDGLQLAMLGNTNSGLVKTALSEAALTLTFAPGKCGKATITVSATDADGVSVKETLLVTVLPRLPAGTGVLSTFLSVGK